MYLNYSFWSCRLIILWADLAHFWLYIFELIISNTHRYKLLQRVWWQAHSMCAPNRSGPRWSIRVSSFKIKSEESYIHLWTLRLAVIDRRHRSSVHYQHRCPRLGVGFVANKVVGLNRIYIYLCCAWGEPKYINALLSLDYAECSQCKNLKELFHTNLFISWQPYPAFAQAPTWTFKFVSGLMSATEHLRKFVPDKFGCYLWKVRQWITRKNL